MADKKPNEIRLVIDRAEEVTRPPAPPDDDDPPPLHLERLPPDCPVLPLGVLGDTCYYLDALHQFREVVAEKHGRLGLQLLFGAQNYLLERYWPRRNADNAIVGWKPELAAAALMASAAKKGVWNPLEKLRGRGAWLGVDGELILHCGDAVRAGREWFAPGIFGRHVYPAYDAVPRPAEKPQASGDGGPAGELLAILRTWNWRHKGVDELLMLGWICAAMLGGAVKWRPAAWLTGGSGSGKSTLQELLERLFDGGLIHAAEASAAGIWQKLGHSSLPVAVDEQEGEEDNRKVNALVKLARLAASGGLILRGGADHTGAEFIARSCFLFSSILIPPLLGQDRNRMAVLELGDLAGETPPDLTPAKMAELGRRLLRRLVDGWPRWHETLENYRAALARAGHSARRCDVFGTLMAAADLAMFDEGEADHNLEEQLARKLETVIAGDLDDSARDEELWLGRLLTSALPLEGPVQRRPIGDWIGRVCEKHPDDEQAEEAARILGLYGLKVIRDKARGNAPTHLAVANYHQGLARLFEGTHWAARSGTMGVWVQAVRRLPMADRSKSAVYFAGAYAKATLVPIDLAWQPNDAERPRRAAAPNLPLDT